MKRILREQTEGSETSIRVEFCLPRGEIDETSMKQIVEDLRRTTRVHGTSIIIERVQPGQSDRDGNILREIQAANPMTAAAFAKLVGVSEGYLSRVRNGKTPLTPTLATKFLQLGQARKIAIPPEIRAKLKG